MQETDYQTTSYNVSEPPRVATAPTHHSGVSFNLHLPDAKKLLPVSPRLIVRMVGAWLILLIVLNTAAVKMADKPHLSQAEAVASSKMRANLSADEERQANIDSLTVYIQKYYEAFGIYPSTSQINSVEFRKADPAFKIANRRTFIDPLGGTSGQLALTPTKNAYFYAPVPANCDSSHVMCSGYTVGATLQNGQLYAKHN